MTAALLSLTGITMTFPGVTALDNVDLRLRSGEVHALMGENGAGKSTLIKVLTGVYEPDAGTVTLDGAPVRFASPLHAQQAGVSTVYQEVNLCPNLSVAENIFIGREPRRLGRIQWRVMRQRATQVLSQLELSIDVSAPLNQYSLAIQQMVAIARAINPGENGRSEAATKVLILDEPTSSLDADEVAQLFRIVRRLRDDGLAILFVTHFLDQVYEISDRITVLRNGRLVGEYRTAELPQVQLVANMIGRELESLEHLDDRRSALEAVERGQPLLAAHEIGRKGSVAPFTLTIHKGEVVGLAGLLGSGRTELARLIFGADRHDHGRFELDGRPASIQNPVAAVAAGIGFSPENRRAEGLVPELTLRENIILALQAARGWARAIPRRRQDELVDRYIAALHIVPANPDIAVGNLSGGNQQKVLLARWLITEPKLLILDEPTRGIDIGAKAEIQRLVVELASGGMAVLFVSAELDEVLRLSHKVAVLRDRRVVTELANDQTLTAETVMQTIASGGRS